tara:strand:+ start:41 stop:340 length:300 start_codon:yes stop_codon:yes gene_type:complete
MTYSKSFPNTIEGSSYPKWEEINLTPEEEKEQEELCRKDNIELMKKCIDDAKNIMQDNLKDYQSDLINIAISLFEKRASFAIHYKEQKAKEKFDLKFKK